LDALKREAKLDLRVKRIKVFDFQPGEPGLDERAAGLGCLLWEEMTATGEGDVLEGGKDGFEAAGAFGWDDFIVVSPEEQGGEGQRTVHESFAEDGHVGLPGAEDLEDAAQCVAVTEDAQVGLEVAAGDGVRRAGGLVIGPEDHEARGDGDAEGEKASPTGEIEGDDVRPVAFEGMGRTHEDESGDGHEVNGGEPEGEVSAVGVADDDGIIDVRGAKELRDEFGERVGGEVERRGIDGSCGQDVERDDSAVGGEICDELGEGFCRCEELVEEKEWSVGRGLRGKEFDVLKADAGDGDVLQGVGHEDQAAGASSGRATCRRRVCMCLSDRSGQVRSS
jgi:hypothetical protein